MNQFEPQPPIEKPSCPAWLCYEAKVEWKRIVPKLMALGLLTKIDRATLAAYCQAYGRWAKAEKALKAIEEKFEGAMNVNAAGGLCYMTQPNGNWVTHPLVHVANRAMEQMQKFSAEFGMSPVARSRINTEPPKSGDALDEMLNTIGMS